MSSPKIAIIIYTLYGHVTKLAKSVKSRIESAGKSMTIYQVVETLTPEVLEKMHAPPKPTYPVLAPVDLIQFTAFMFSVPTCYGSLPAQLKMFIDGTGPLWSQGALVGKYTAVFVSTGGPGGSQEATALSIVSMFIHHGIIFIPLGYSKAFSILANISEVHGGMFASGDRSHLPSVLELELAKVQGKQFYSVMSKVRF